MTRLVSVDELLGLVARAFEAHGMSAANAAIVAEVCVAAERDGSIGHGLLRVGNYVSTLDSGWVDGKAVPTLQADDAAAVLRVNARNGFAQPALRLAKAPAIEKARANGICVISIENSHHLAALWPDVEMFARDGLVALATVNSIPRVVPFGGNKAVYGTNPMAFAAPRGSDNPLVFDQASSAMAFGEVKAAAVAEHTLPAGIGVDRNGRPTLNPDDIINGGALLPYGGHKGSSIAMMVEILAAALTGGKFSFEVDFSGYPGAQTPHTGELLILIDPRQTTSKNFTARIELLVAALHESGQLRLPGDRRYQNRARATSLGIPVSVEMLNAIERMSHAPAGTRLPP